MNQALPEKDASITQAIDFMRHNRPLRAEETCRDYLNKHPGCADHLRMLGHALMKQNRFPEAEEQLRFALSMEPEFPQLHEDLGSVLALQSRFEEAIPAFEKAIQLQPALPLAHKKLGQALAEVGRGADADEAFQVYVDRDPDRAAIAEGIKHQQEGRSEDAIKAFRAVLKNNPNSVNAMRYLAVAYWQEDKKIEDAEALLRRATQLAPDYTGAWLILGALLLERNKHVDAVAAYQKATDLEPKNAEAWGGLAMPTVVQCIPTKVPKPLQRPSRSTPRFRAFTHPTPMNLKQSGTRPEH